MHLYLENLKRSCLLLSAQKSSSISMCYEHSRENSLEICRFQFKNWNFDRKRSREIRGYEIFNNSSFKDINNNI